MNKTYLQPATQAFRVNTQQFIAASITKGDKTAEVTLDDEEYNDVFNSRRHNNVWGDEEIEEESL